MSIFIENLIKKYKLEDQEIEILKEVTLEVNSGEFISIMGPSGSGKSTLLKCISTLENFDSGNVYYDGDNIALYNDQKKSDFRRKYLGYIFQEYNLLDIFTVKENIILPLIIERNDKSYIKNELKNLIQDLNLSAVADKYPSDLSGGEKQRVAIGRCFIKKPKYIFADEPTGALDSVNSQNTMNMLKSLNESGSTLIMVTHDPFSACYSDRVIFLKDGKIYNELKKSNESHEVFHSRILRTIENIGGES